MITSQPRATEVIAPIVSVDIARAAKTVSFAAGAEHALAKIEQAATATPDGIPAAAGARPAAIPSGNSALIGCTDVDAVRRPLSRSSRRPV